MSDFKSFKTKLANSKFEILEVSQAQAAPEWASGRSPVVRQTVLHVVKGDGELSLNGAVEPLENDSTFVFLPGNRVELRLRSAKTNLLYWVVFDRYALASKTAGSLHYVKEDDFPVRGKVRLTGYNPIRTMALLMSSAGIREGESRSFHGQQLLFDLLQELLEQAPAAKDLGPATRLQETVGYMLQNYHENIQMSRLAELGKFHPAYYSQIFKQMMDKTPMSYITDLRINKAKELLLTTDKPVSDIAASVGYNDEFYFSRRFKEKSGYAPSVFTQKRELRTISLSSPYTDQLYTLGHIPRAAQIYRSAPIQTQQLLLPEHGADPWNARREIFMKVQPDLIVCKDNILNKAREQINDIAPIISIPWASRDIYRHMRDIAELVDRRQAADEWLDGYERRAEAWRRKLKRELGSPTVALCVCRDRELRMYGARNIGHVFYRSLNLKAPDAIARQMKRHPAGTGFTWTAISPDEIKLYEADYLFAAVETEGDKQRLLHWTRTHAAWTEHPAVRAGRLIFIDWEKWMMYSPSGIQFQLDEAGYLLTRRA